MLKNKKTLDLSTAKGLRVFYRSYNHFFYGDRLPENVVVHFEKLEYQPDGDAANLTFTGEGLDAVVDIAVDERLRGMDCVVAWLLTHEMNHVDLIMRGLTRTQHGPKFDAGMLRLAKSGGLNGIW